MPLTSNSVQIYYETFGKADHPALLLISGLGEQMVAWPEKFCRMLADSDLFVIRFDNRDSGFSTKPDLLKIPNLLATWGAYFKETSISPPYTLQDMAADAVSVLDALEIQKACACGFSLGGMISQNMAFEFSRRLSSMICMGSSTGSLHLPPPAPEVQAVMATPPPQTREEYIRHIVWVFNVFSGGSEFYDAECRAETAAQSYDRCFHPIGFLRQSVAMLADGSRQERLHKVEVPTLVLHGESDPLVQPVHGRAIAEAVHNAELVIVPEWGHGLDYPRLWPLLIRHLADFLKSDPIFTGTA
ncbi:alpha/beta hydrolase [Desulfococcaceae bacterium HSG8]|nr:alpha/beta hydrolase [Desulfococcaceae bacterium HSG8]